MASDVLGMVLAGGRVGELSVLTLLRPKSAVPFGGIYRVIDFPLSNLANSGVDVGSIGHGMGERIRCHRPTDFICSSLAPPFPSNSQPHAAPSASRLCRMTLPDSAN